MGYRSSWPIVTLAMFLGIALTFPGCSEKGGGTRFGNLPPETVISIGPKEQSCNYYRVQTYWYGADLDGQVDRFDVATLQGAELSLLTVGDYDSLPWVRTTSSESLFVFTTDSCCTPDENLWYGRSRWALLVRAIDNDWAKDPEPARLLFETCNAVPTVRFTIPEKIPVDYLALPAHPYIAWQGQDPDGDASELMYKYIVIPEADMNPDYPRLPPLDKDSSGVDHHAPAVGDWSKWVPADCTYVSDLDLSAWAGLDPMPFLRFYVTVKDEGGAVLPEDLYRSYNYSRNWRRFIVLPGDKSRLQTVVDGGILGRRWSFDTVHYTTTVTPLFSGPEISFRFWADESRSRWDMAEAYRYYFDSASDPNTSTWDVWTPVEPIRQPDRRPEWIVRFPEDGSQLLPSPGQHVFVVEVQDADDRFSHCEFYIDVLESPRGKPGRIYLVDDNVDDGLLEPYPWHEQGEDSLWAEILAGYSYEVFDTGPDFEERVSARPMSDATTVIWAVGQDLHQGTQLMRLCTEYGNFLHSYVRSGGNLIIIGLNPIYAHAFWPDQRWLPWERAFIMSYDFRPPDIVGPDTTVNFNWDILGIETMAGISEKFKTIAPCEAGWTTIDARPIAGHPDWDGTFGYAFFITGVRDDITVHKLYGTVPLDSEGQPQDPDCTKWLAAYVPADETRGHAAYVGVPPWLCDHDQVRAMVRHLLDLFGEEPAGS